ncbi:MAG: hypothetical protein AAFV09_10255, partial [Pseudomonadota bacterium]
MSFDVDIIVVGGGLTGPALALACSLAGATAIVLDAGPEPTDDAPPFDGRSYAVALGSRNLLGALGVWPQLAEVAEPILDIVVSDERAEGSLLDLPMVEMGKHRGDTLPCAPIAHDDVEDRFGDLRKLRPDAERAQQVPR